MSQSLVCSSIPCNETRKGESVSAALFPPEEGAGARSGEGKRREYKRERDERDERRREHQERDATNGNKHTKLLTQRTFNERNEKQSENLVPVGERKSSPWGCSYSFIATEDTRLSWLDEEMKKESLDSCSVKKVSRSITFTFKS